MVGVYTPKIRSNMSFRSNVAQFFRALARAFAFARVTLGNLLVLLVVTLIAIAMFTPSDQKPVLQGSALYLAPVRIVETKSQVDPLMALSGTLPVGAETRLSDILEAIDRAAADSRIAELVLNPSNLLGASPAHLEAIGQSIDLFRQSGKRVTAFGAAFGRDQYLLASFADEIYADPFGEVLPSGYGLIGTYFGDFFDRYGINVRVFKTGRYKSTVEPYTESGPSDHTRESHQAVVDELWSRYVNRIASNRLMDAKKVRDLFERIDEAVVDFDGDTPRFAFENGLVDQLLTNDAVQARLIETLGSENGSFRHVTVADYLGGALPQLPLPNTVAVISTSGMILPGRQPRGIIGAYNLSRLIRQARQDDDVRALVVRLDSPGGSAFASEQIRRELELFQQSGRPVVVSMGATAASGGYWIAATADQIWAAPSTITGSIGVFSMIPTFEETLADFGIRTEGVVAGPWSANSIPSAASPIGWRRSCKRVPISPTAVSSTPSRVGEISRRKPSRRLRRGASGRARKRWISAWSTGSVISTTPLPPRRIWPAWRATTCVSWPNPSRRVNSSCSRWGRTSASSISRSSNRARYCPSPSSGWSASSASRHSKIRVIPTRSA